MPCNQIQEFPNQWSCMGLTISEKKFQKAAARESVAPFSLASQLLKRFPRVVRARFDMRVNRETINRS